MATDVPMPKLGLTMEEAMIVEWLVADGSVVARDQPILLIETDKTETEVGSPGDGRLHQVGRPGDVFPCGELVGWLLAEGEQPPEPTGPSTSSATPTTRAPAAIGSTEPRTGAASGPPLRDGRILASPNARRVAAERSVDLRTIRGTGPAGRIVSEDVEAAVPGTRPGIGQELGSVVATAAARQLADLLGVDIARVPADPHERRVTREGVALHVRGLLQRLAPASPPAPTRGTPGVAASLPLLQEPTEIVRMAGMRGTIARRMHASLLEMAQLTLTMDADMTAVLADRAARKGSMPDAAVPSVTDYVVAATARALTAHPRMNAQVTESGIALLPEVHVGLAVAVEHGLLVPVVTDAAHRDIDGIAAETSRLAAACRDGSVTPADLEGGTFSVSALGAFGVDVFTPVINPPNAGILGVGRLRDDLVLVDGEISTTTRLTLSLSWDHRVLDGVPAAQFCRTIVELLADPTRLA